jgi:hypothetical protein
VTGRACGGEGPVHYGLGVIGFCLDPSGCGADDIEVNGHCADGSAVTCFSRTTATAARPIIVQLNAYVAEARSCFLTAR